MGATEKREDRVKEGDADDIAYISGSWGKVEGVWIPVIHTVILYGDTPEDDQVFDLREGKVVIEGAGNGTDGS